MNKYGHWLLVILVGISFIPGFYYFEFTLAYMMAIIFGIIGFSAVLYMAIVIQIKHKNKTI
ncbi:hypothetical protein [Peribacillus frigoritolerans]|uniref:hypothetical protein n=1 Tax=Peribacillus frigoritolerans TaxID=450367 RepID=UPI001059C25B|nr:hypothetical protein [Peribacillus frigoritolerans]TDL82936.1 hypothetical protein E2R53_05195 [Peribacillus frigoritolerans]